MQKEIPINPTDTSETLAPTLAAIGADIVAQTLRGLQAGTITSRPQDNEKATLAPILKKEDARIDFRRTALEITNRLRGFQPWPGAFTTFRGKNLQVSDAALSHHSIPPGELLVEKDRLMVGCGGGTALALLALQPEGKKHMAVRDFIHGYRPQSGEKLGS
jgi:methionyl-tRNA formyltransferase